MSSCPAQPSLHFSQVRKACEIFKLAVAAAQSLVLIAIPPIRSSPDCCSGKLAPGPTGRRKYNSCHKPEQGAEPTGGGQLPSVVVTGYLIPRVGVGPQPVTSYDQSYIQKTGYQNVTDVLQNLPIATGNFNPGVTPGFSFSPASASIALKDLLPNNTLVLVDGLRMPSSPFPQESRAVRSTLSTLIVFRWQPSIVSRFSMTAVAQFTVQTPWPGS